MNLRETLLQKSARKTGAVFVPGKGEIKIRALYEDEKVRLYENWFYKDGERIKKRIKHMRTRMIVLSVYDGDPEVPLFEEPDEETILRHWLHGEILAVFRACNELSQMDEKEAEDELGNSEGQQD